MASGTKDLEHFSRLIDTLAPWLEEVVVVGGWAHRLYPLANELDYLCCVESYVV
jgi:hypothetical protein